MDIQDLGAIGEFVSSIVVFITLIYLAVQVRHTRSELSLSVQSRWGRAVREIWQVRCQNPDLIDAIIKAENDVGRTYTNHGFIVELVNQKGFTEREAYLLFSDQILQWENWITSIENLENQSPDNLARLNAAIKNIYSTGIGAIFWKNQRISNIEKKSIKYIESMLET